MRHSVSEKADVTAIWRKVILIYLLNKKSPPQSEGNFVKAVMIWRRYEYASAAKLFPTSLKQEKS